MRLNLSVNKITGESMNGYWGYYPDGSIKSFGDVFGDTLEHQYTSEIKYWEEQKAEKIRKGLPYNFEQIKIGLCKNNINRIIR